jgi:hypothetical protein
LSSVLISIGVAQSHYVVQQGGEAGELSDLYLSTGLVAPATACSSPSSHAWMGWVQRSLPGAAATLSHPAKGGEAGDLTRLIVLVDCFCGCFYFY